MLQKHTEYNYNDLKFLFTKHGKQTQYTTILHNYIQNSDIASSYIAKKQTINKNNNEQ